MAEAKGSSSGGGGGGGGGGDFNHFMGGAGGPQGYQALLASVGAPSTVAPTTANSVHGQQLYTPAAGRLIRHPAPLSVPMPPPYAPQLAGGDLSPRFCAQPAATSSVPPGGGEGAGYHCWTAAAGSHHHHEAAAATTAAAEQVPAAGSRSVHAMCSNDYIPVAPFCYCCAGAASAGAGGSNNGYGYYHGCQLSRPCSTAAIAAAWPGYVMRSPFYAPGLVLGLDHRQPPNPYQSIRQEDDPGLLSSFGLDQPLVSSSSFPAISPLSNNSSSARFFSEESTHNKKLKCESMYTPSLVMNREDPLDIESENSDEQQQLDHNQVAHVPNLNQQGYDGLTPRFNCRGYRVVVCKDLTNSDVGTIGRIVMPKRDAEANLPALLEKDGVILKMDDFKLPITWNFKYRFWPNNKSRMYILESTGEFVKSHGLQAGDTLIIYKSPESYRYIVRGEKATQHNAPMVCPDCKDGNGGDGCKFTRRSHARMT